jgi:hypothetical protein
MPDSRRWNLQAVCYRRSWRGSLGRPSGYGRRSARVPGSSRPGNGSVSLCGLSLEGLAVVSAVVLAQITYSGRHAVCAFYESPLRLPALVAWFVVFGALLGFGALGLTPGGAGFLARIWPALAVTKPRSIECGRRGKSLSARF